MTAACTNTRSAASLSSLITTYHTTRKPTTILITGPCGSGKTTLLNRHELSTLPVHTVRPALLADPEQTLAKLFYHVSVVLFDNLDLYAPPQASASETRLIAALVHVLSYTPALFIATAGSLSAVHPALREKLVHVVPLDALSYHERLEACVGFGRHATTLAEVTPGFLWADMRKLFMRLAEVPATDIVTALPGVLHDVRPALLIGQEPAQVYTTLHGLETQQQELREVLRAVFPEKGITTSATRALERIGSFRGVLIHGGTGCGKTALARASRRFVPEGSVNFLEIAGTEVVGSAIGAGERELRRVFTTARAIAPCVVIIDNIDIVAPRRTEETAGDGARRAFERVLSTLLVLVDGVVKDDRRVLVVGTTRDLRLVDGALLRPGRFDMHIRVDVPGAEARSCIMQEVLDGCRASAREVGIDESFLRMSEGWTAAEVAAHVRRRVLQTRASFI